LGTSFMQNGIDAVALFRADGRAIVPQSFPVDTPPRTLGGNDNMVGCIDAVVYAASSTATLGAQTTPPRSGAERLDDFFAVLTQFDAQVGPLPHPTTKFHAETTGKSLGRLPNAASPFSAQWLSLTPTPGAANEAPALTGYLAWQAVYPGIGNEQADPDRIRPSPRHPVSNPS
jgi:hypothetical protein